MPFTILGPLSSVEVIAVGNSIRELARLQKVYGKGRWRKLKGFAKIELEDETVCEAELHW